MRKRIVAAVASLALLGAADRPASLNDRLSGDTVPTHDPVLIRDGGAYYIYSTGQRDRRPLAARQSDDLVTWRALPPPVTTLPDWARAAVPGAKEMWAPDISHADGRFRLYYSVSTFGSRRSAIGLMTSAALDPAAPGYGWRDEGPVITSRDANDFNAIDPNFVRDRKGGAWLAFGSFWSGLKLVQLDPATGKLADPAAAPIAIARRGAAQGHAIEAPFIVDRGGWYWLIASAGYCCRGVKSDYHLVVGRARNVTGPYVDRAGRAMLDGGGTMLLQADAAGKDRFRGPGHAGMLRDRGRDYLVYHAYDAANAGRSTLRLARLRWGADGWPQVSQ